MKIEIKFNKKFKKPEDIRRLMELTDMKATILDIIDDKTAIGREVVDFRGDTQFVIKFKKR